MPEASASVAVALGVSAAAAWGFSDYFIAVISRRIGTISALVVMQVTSLAAYFLIFVLVAPDVNIDAAGWWGFAGLSVLVVINYLLFFKALELGPISIVTPVVAAYAAVVVLLAVVLRGEALTPLQWVGCGLAIGGAIAVSGDLRALANGLKLSRGVLYGFGALFGFGVTAFLAGVLSQSHGWLVPPLVTRVMTAVAFVFIAAVRKEAVFKAAGIGYLSLVGAVGVLEALGFLAFTRGAELGFIAIVSAASASYPLIPIVLGLVLLKESLSPNQVAGAAAVLGGVGLLGLAG